MDADKLEPPEHLDKDAIQVFWDTVAQLRASGVELLPIDSMILGMYAISVVLARRMQQEVKEKGLSDNPEAQQWVREQWAQVLMISDELWGKSRKQ
ncbi:MAG: hypothetical protein ACKV22_01045 [Bryobacteraceae bacterium]